MAGLTHAGVGLAAKQVAPKAPLWLLMLGAYGIDIVWGGFALARVEHFPKAGRVSIAYWSHGLFMSTVWSSIAATVAGLVSRKPRTALLAGLLVFSHWVVDFIAKPMTYSFPSDSGLPLLFKGSPTVGLGVWRSKAGTMLGEYGATLIGLAIYLRAIGRLRFK